jgi:hypothetical protein
VIVELNLFLIGWLTYYRHAGPAGLHSNVWISGFGVSCAAIVSNNASGDALSPRFSGDWGVSATG